MALDQAPPAADLLVQTTSSQGGSSQLSAGVTSVPVGAILDYGGTSAPSGWLICDGSLVSRNLYSNLFTAIGTQFGVGDGSTTFGLPDCQGRMTVGQSGVTGHTDVTTIGNNDGSSLAHRRPKHRHTVNDVGHGHTYLLIQGGSGTEGTNAAGNQQYNSSGTSSNTTGITVGNDATNDPLDAPAYIVFNKIIKA